MDYEAPQFFHVMRYATEAEGDVIDMVSGDPDWDPPSALRDGLREFADFEPKQFQYPPSEGLDRLRELIADDRGIDQSQLVITHGAGEANYLAMARAFERDAGDEAVLLDPVYPYYPAKINMIGGTVRTVQTAPDGDLDVDVIAEAVSTDTAVIVLNTPNNPTGAVYRIDDIRAVVEIAEDHDALVVVDEVYDKFDLSGRFTSAQTIDSDHCIVTSGFSKSMAITGLRIGYAIAPAAHIGAMKARHMITTVAGSRPGQYAVLRALEETPPSYYSTTRSLIAERIEAFTTALDGVGAAYTTPHGAFYVLARFDGFPGTLENIERLIDEAGVAGMPGDAFGAGRADWLRFALVTDRTTEAADRLGAYFQAR